MLRLNPFGLRIDREGWWFEHSVLCHSCGFACQQRVLKTFPGPGYIYIYTYIYIYIYIYIYMYTIHINKSIYNIYIFIYIQYI